jgi:hypothetical protein
MRSRRGFGGYTQRITDGDGGWRVVMLVPGVYTDCGVVRTVICVRSDGLGANACRFDGLVQRQLAIRALIASVAHAVDMVASRTGMPPTRRPRRHLARTGQLTPARASRPIVLVQSQWRSPRLSEPNRRLAAVLVRCGVNTGTSVYHCEGTRWYGRTKKGEAMGLYTAGEPAGFFGSLVGAIILRVIYYFVTRKSV